MTTLVIPHTPSGATPHRERQFSEAMRRGPQPGRGTTTTNLCLGARCTIYADGERAEAVYVLVSGAVALTRTSLEGRRQILEILGPGALFGLVGGETYDTSAETLIKAVVRRIERDAICRSERLQREMTLHLLSKVEAFHDHTARLGRKSAMERVASLLLELPQIAGPREGVPARDERIALALADIGDYLGLNIETVCRALQRLKTADIVSQPRRGRLVIVDAARLRQLAARCPARR